MNLMRLPCVHVLIKNYRNISRSYNRPLKAPPKSYTLVQLRQGYHTMSIDEVPTSDRAPHSANFSYKSPLLTPYIIVYKS